MESISVSRHSLSVFRSTLPFASRDTFRRDIFQGWGVLQVGTCGWEDGDSIKGAIPPVAFYPDLVLPPFLENNSLNLSKIID